MLYFLLAIILSLMKVLIVTIVYVYVLLFSPLNYNVDF
jgi:hypothetical protein